MFVPLCFYATTPTQESPPFLWFPVTCEWMTPTSASPDLCFRPMHTSSYLTSSSEYHTGTSNSTCSKMNSPFLSHYFCLCIFFPVTAQFTLSLPRKNLLFITHWSEKDIYFTAYSVPGSVCLLSIQELKNKIPVLNTVHFHGKDLTVSVVKIGQNSTYLRESQVIIRCKKNTNKMGGQGVGGWSEATLAGGSGEKVEELTFEWMMKICCHRQIWRNIKCKDPIYMCACVCTFYVGVCEYMCVYIHTYMYL